MKKDRKGIANNFALSAIAYIGCIVYIAVGIYVTGVIAVRLDCKEWYLPIMLIVLAALVLFMCLVLAVKDDKLECFWEKYVFAISTKPGIQHYKWQGGYSILAGSILWLIAAVRCISGLQVAKFIFRKIADAMTDNVSDRPNISPLFQEVYYCIWLGILAVCYNRFSVPSNFLIGLAWFYMVESTVWILFYSVFRRFYDENYAIYHELEHLPMIFVVIISQAFAFCLINRGVGTAYINFEKILLVLLGQGDEISGHIGLTILGVLYAAIVVSLIISNFTNEQIKRGRPALYIIGNGDVVKNRLIGAIRKRDERANTPSWSSFQVHDLEGVDGAKSVTSLFGQKKWGTGIVWIASPSDTHWDYVDVFRHKVPFLVVEKPIASSEEEILAFEEYVQTEQRNKTFFLSYYMLEKALPLIYLKRPLAEYKKYLFFHGENEVTFSDCYRDYSKLGNLKSICVKILEKEDDRNLPNGGQFVETFIHNLLIAAEFVGLPDRWEQVEIDFGGEPIAEAKHIQLKAQKGPTSIELLMRKDNNWIQEKKYQGKKDRGKVQTAKLVYEKGSIDADFDTRTVELKFQEDNEIIYTIEVKEEYKQPYMIQSDMVYECFVEKLNPSGFDGLRNQIPVLKWMMQYCKK